MKTTKKQPNTVAERVRLQEQYSGKQDWLHWGPYLSERQWGTVREDYSPYGNAWEYFSHDHARSRTYRWGEDGIAGISDEKQRLCFSIALWNGKDPILKERLFGLTGNEGNHGEDVKELYYYLDSTPTHSYMKHLYKYPQRAFPYADLVETNRSRDRYQPEYELLDTGIFDENRYFDVFTEYAKASEQDILIRITVHNRGSEAAPVHLLPTLWFRNNWSFGQIPAKPRIRRGADTEGAGSLQTEHPGQCPYTLYFEPTQTVLFTENETNTERVFGYPSAHPFTKDAFHRAIIGGEFDSLSQRVEGSKAAPVYQLTIPAGESVTVKLRLSRSANSKPLGAEFDQLVTQRVQEADEFYATIQSPEADAETKNIQRQAFAGMLWSKQFYYLDVPQWLDGDPGQPAPPAERKHGRNHQWRTLNNEDIISMPDKWEYPWYAAWDLAFHCVPLARVDPQFAKNQLILFLREWYMHPNGQLPAYEWAFGDVNPPVHAWSCLAVYKLEAAQTGVGDVDFLKRVFLKLLLNFTWWVNRKDAKGNNVFEGGFLGLDNIGVFDRSNQIPGGGRLEQADGTSWMAMYCLNMLEMALEIAKTDVTYEDVATKFFEHFVYIAESLNRLGEDWDGSWDENEAFFYDILELPGQHYIPLKIRSLVGLSTLFAVLKIPRSIFAKLPDFTKRMRWFQQYQKQGKMHIVVEDIDENQDLLLSLIPPDRLERLLHAMLDEGEFLAPGGIRSISKIHEHGYSVHIDGQEFGLRYEPGESSSGLFGGNSNWRGPIWMPMNYLLVCALRTYHSYYGNQVQVEFPTGSGQQISLGEAASMLAQRLVGIFRPDANGYRPVNGNEGRYATDPHFKDLVLFYEYFHGDTSRGVGASHQTGWTGVIADLIGS
ncbi:MGH1-like glycoside hydrolase domain-containing protein [Spirosoma aerolatum]|uniref:MGH1-like glycoside hydrolase domain-containing protein n=1 Tax=Spirosoma aerolatum TaxID=1211326 RepID=UPI0009AD37BC|nr:glucosidase [Spirosoma aerolatum]